MVLVPAFCIVAYAAVSGVINLFGTFNSKSEKPAEVSEVKKTEITAKPPLQAGLIAQEASASKPEVKADESLAEKQADVTDNKTSETLDTAQAQPGVPLNAGHEKKDLYRFLGQPSLSTFMASSFEVQHGTSKFTVKTSINNNLQNFLSESIDSVKNLRQGKPRYFGIVAMDPATGKILGMGGFDGDPESKGICPGNLYPAASVFKIITAAAAVESKGFTPGTQMLFHGNKYTLYKSQVNDSRDRYATKISLNDSFAQSINPVFGKIGSQYLSKEVLASYGNSLGFNKKFDFELPLQQSFLEISGDKFHQAEIASGYNRDTKISPIHGAMIASAVINEGRLPEPYLVEQISNEKGELIYQASPKLGEQVISPETANTLKQLMESTVSKGTGKKSFAGSENDVVLKSLDMGGKTGSIDNPTHEVRFDWFVGFAKSDEGKKVAVAIVVGHEKFIGTKASRYARMIFKRYFQPGNT